MNVTLAAINAKYIHSSPVVYSLKAYYDNYHEDGAAHITVREYNIQTKTDDIIRGIMDTKPDVVGLSCYIWNITLVLNLCDILKKAYPELVIVLGGPEISYENEEIIRQYPIDHVVIGEGERAFAELIDSLHADKNETSGSGLKSDPLRISSAKPIALDDIPFIYSPSNLNGQSVGEAFKHRIVYYESSRGCPYSCGYCLSERDKSVRFLSIERVKRDMAVFLAERVPLIKFTDRTFNCNAKHAEEIWRYLNEHDNAISCFHFEIAGDLLTDKQIEFLNGVRKGLFQFEIGVQSANGNVLNAINRKSDTSRLFQNISSLVSAETSHIHADLIAGLPEEDFRMFAVSFDAVYKLKPDMLQLGFLKLLKGTPIRENAEALGIAYEYNAPYEVIKTKRMSFDELMRLKAVEEVLNIFYNHGRYKRTITYLESFFEHQGKTTFDLYDVLGAFWYGSDLHTVSHKESDKYVHLHNFCLSIGVEETLARDLLRYDLYTLKNEYNPPECLKHPGGTVVLDKERNMYVREEVFAWGTEQFLYDAKSRR